MQSPFFELKRPRVTQSGISRVSHAFLAPLTHDR